MEYGVRRLEYDDEVNVKLLPIREKIETEFQIPYPNQTITLRLFGTIFTFKVDLSLGSPSRW
jgi:hypothetical protein